MALASVSGSVAQDAHVGESSGEAFALEPAAAVPEKRPRAKDYKRPLREYAEQLGYDSDRSMKRWIEEGRSRAPQDLPPFDDLPQLANWWRRVKPKRKVPAEILRFEEAGSAAQPAAPVKSASSGQTNSPDAAPGTTRDRQTDVHMTPELVVQKLRDMYKSRYEQWCRAVDNNAPDADRIERLMSDAADKLLKWERNLMTMRRDRGELLDESKLNPEVVSMWSVMAQSFFNALLSLAQTLAPEKPASERRALVIPLRDSCFGHLKRTRFSSAFLAFERDLTAA